jgi:antitoxin ParD1/3/4
MIVRIDMRKNTSLGPLKEQEAKLSALRAALFEGENSGPPAAFDFDRFIARKRKAEPPAT